jgi:hypothetical protein
MMFHVKHKRLNPWDSRGLPGRSLKNFQRSASRTLPEVPLPGARTHRGLPPQDIAHILRNDQISPDCAVIPQAVLSPLKVCFKRRSIFKKSNQPEQNCAYIDTGSVFCKRFSG